jgi:integrase
MVADDRGNVISALAMVTVETGIAALRPEELAPMAEAAVAALLQEGESVNTQASYRSALRYWAAWFALRYRRTIELPVAPTTVLQFIVDHVERSTEDGLAYELPEAIDALLVSEGFKGRPGPLALNTVGHRLAVLSKLHALHAQPNPCRVETVRDLLAKTRRAYAKRGAFARRKTALTREPLDALLATCEPSLRGIRDRALLLFAWSSGGRRRSEVVGATLENTCKSADGAWVYTLGHDKANQTGTERPENDKPVVGAAAQALDDWLAKSGIRSGRIFRRIRKGSTVGEPLSPSAVRKIVQERCLRAGLDGDYSAHSLRSGFVTEAGRQNVALGDTMAMTGHASVATVMKYFRSGQATTNQAARLFDRSESSTTADLAADI